jgi:hypothetical protein
MLPISIAPRTHSSPGIRICDVAEHSGSPGGHGVRFRLEVRLTESDIGKRAVIRWRRPAGGSREEIADVLGILEAVDASSLRIRKASGEVVTIPRDRALAGKTIPPPPHERAADRAEVPGDGR